uniref:PEP-CTERM sorting domain-containing protein n=1 Tax=Thalassoglobus sp. TaxID=2795869 RepID=UPI003AA7DE12
DMASLSNLILDLTRFTSWNALNGGFFNLIAGDGGNGLYLEFTAGSESAVPEPASFLLLLSAGACGLIIQTRRRKIAALASE